MLTGPSAKLLARLILSDRSLLGYTDIGKRAFGGWASGAINILYVGRACVACCR